MQYLFKRHLILFSLLMTGVMSPAKQKVDIQNISVKTTQYLGATCLSIKYDVLIDQSYKQLQTAGDTSDGYTVSIIFEETNYIKTARGFDRMADSAGLVNPENRLVIYNDVKVFPGQTVYVPLAAFALDEGTHRLMPVFTIKNQKGEKVPCNFTRDTFSISMPQRIKLKLDVCSIQVSDTDWDGTTWDAWIFNFNTSKPEVFWTTLLMGKHLYSSGYTRNSFTYSDPDGRDSQAFSICKGDIFYISVYDFDQLSANDLIGTLKIDMDNYHDEGIKHMTTFGLVLNMDYTMSLR